MNPVTEEWIQKAEADYQSCRYEIRRRKMRNCDLVCFLAHQSAEKYLKAMLHAEKARPPYTHKLEVLVPLLRKPHPTLILRLPELTQLGERAIAFRYPGYNAALAEAKWALGLATEIRGIARAHLKLPAE